MDIVTLFHISRELKNILTIIGYLLAIYAAYYLIRAIYRWYRGRLLLNVARKNGLIPDKISYNSFLQLSSVATGTVRRVLGNYWCRKNGVLFGIADVSAFKWQSRTGETGSRGHRDYYSRTVVFIPMKNALPHMGSGYEIRGNNLKRNLKEERPLGYITCEADTFQKIKQIRELKNLLSQVLDLLRISYFPYSLAFEVKDHNLVVYSEKGRVAAKRMEDVIKRSLEVKELLENLSERLSAY